MKLLDDYTFSATIDAEKLPYFWEVSFVNFYPVHMGTWFPGNAILSDDGGARFELPIADDMENVSNTERFAPTVTCGPYNFVSFDGSTVNLQRNPYFKGSPQGLLPSFEYIVQKEVAEAIDVESVLNGDVDFRAGVIAGADIEAARASEYAGLNSYLRPGYGFLAFCLDWGPTEDINVRFAIAFMLDRSIIIDHVLDGYGATVDSAYGLSLWTYQARRRELAQRLIPISFNLDTANDYLDDSIWVFESDGVTPFDRDKANAEGTYLRHNADGEVLRIAAASGSEQIGDAIEATAIMNAPLIGMVFEVHAIDFSLLTDHYYFGKHKPDEERIYNAFQLATNFTAVDDRYFSSHSDYADTSQNPNGISDALLDEIIVEMRFLDPTEQDRHADLWVDYIVRWQEILPAFPLYSNEYFDIYNSIVTQVPTSPFWNWQDAIMHIEKHTP